MDYATAAELARLFGLGLFIAFFAVVAAWTFRPGSRRTYDAHARIPFEGAGEESSK